MLRCPKTPQLYVPLSTLQAFEKVPFVHRARSKKNQAFWQFHRQQWFLGMELLYIPSKTRKRHFTQVSFGSWKENTRFEELCQRLMASQGFRLASWLNCKVCCTCVFETSSIHISNSPYQSISSKHPLRSLMTESARRSVDLKAS